MCFTGKALSVARCELCLASTHTTTECGLQGDTDPELPARMKAIESAVLALAANQGRGGGPIRVSNEPCRLWNNNKCTYPHCKHEHVCSRCRGNHQALVCPSNYRPLSYQASRHPGTHWEIHIERSVRVVLHCLLGHCMIMYASLISSFDLTVKDWWGVMEFDETIIIILVHLHIYFMGN